MIISKKDEQFKCDTKNKHPKANDKRCDISINDNEQTYNLNDEIVEYDDEEKSTTSTCTNISKSSLPSLEESLTFLSFKQPRPVVPADQNILMTQSSILRQPIFSNIPPTINFHANLSIPVHGLHPDILLNLKWKLSSISPAVVRSCVSNSGYRLMKRNVRDWAGTWGKSMKPQQFRLMKEDQKVNHFPGTFHIGRKDRLWKNYRKLLVKHGEEEFNFLPRTFCLPADEKLLRKEWEKESKCLWIVKPPAKARGHGIKVISKWNEIPKTRPLLVQKYIAKPYLINQTKFDLRLYVLLTSINPLRIYLYEDGLVRFASNKYSRDISKVHDVFTHLTNYSINKKSASYLHNEDSMLAEGHKWTLKTLQRYFDEIGVDHSAIWEKIKDLIIKTIISGEKPMTALFQENAKNRYSCFELFGFDILLDSQLKPWLIEVNISPSLHSSSSLDRDVKTPLVAEVFNLARYHIPNRTMSGHQTSLSGQPGYAGLENILYDSRLYSKDISTHDWCKQHAFQQIAEEAGNTSLRPPAGLLDHLSPDDCRHLAVSEDELSISRQFSRIFPTSQTHPYLRFLSKPGYYNLLLSAWEQRYGEENREEGRVLLEQLCQKKYHLRVSLDLVLDAKDFEPHKQCDNSEKKDNHVDLSKDDNLNLKEMVETNYEEHCSFLSVPKPRSEDCDNVYLKVKHLRPDRRPGSKTRGKQVTVVGKPLHVKTVSPCADRGSSRWRMARVMTDRLATTVSEIVINTECSC